MRGIFFISLVLLTGCGGGGSTPPPVTTAKLVNNSDREIEQLYITVNSDSTNATTYLVEFNPPVLPGTSQSVNVEPAFCGVNVMIEYGQGIFDQASYDHHIPCGTSTFECGITNYFDTTFNVMRYVTSCGNYSIAVLPTIPVAVAGSDQFITTGSTVNLYAGGSYDVGGDDLSYEWSIIAKPAGSNAIISNLFNVNASFFSDADGIYNINLAVSDPNGSIGIDQIAIVSIPTGFFTLGSHKDEVLLVQGTPTAINNVDALGYYEWSYGTGTDVRFSTENDRVIAWDNSNGSLMVTMVQGNNITAATFISLGSHRDDVIRLQGTPIAVSKGPSYYEWKYGIFTYIRFSTSDYMVTAWNNYDGSLILQ